jgi:hypothetical protein
VEFFYFILFYPRGVTPPYFRRRPGLHPSLEIRPKASASRTLGTRHRNSRLACITIRVQTLRGPSSICGHSSCLSSSQEFAKKFISLGTSVVFSSSTHCSTHAFAHSPKSVRRIFGGSQAPPPAPKNSPKFCFNSSLNAITTFSRRSLYPATCACTHPLRSHHRPSPRLLQAGILAFFRFQPPFSSYTHSSNPRARSVIRKHLLHTRRPTSSIFHSQAGSNTLLFPCPSATHTRSCRSPSSAHARARNVRPSVLGRSATPPCPKFLLKKFAFSLLAPSPGRSRSRVTRARAHPSNRILGDS